MIWKLPFDIPLVTPTLGLPLEFFSVLGIIVFVVHISFIYMLIGASTASVVYNIIGVFKKDSNYDKFAYRMTNYTTVSENMGALWGVAPLLVISVLFTGFFYTAILKVSPHILHIIYGNIIAFLLSYAYKFSWHALENHKGFHIAIGISAVLAFFTLPFVFMSMSNLYMQPELFATVNSIWDIMFTPVTGFRLLNFFLSAFMATGVVMIFIGARWVKAGDVEIGKIAISQGKKWFLWATPLNIVVLPLLPFVFTPRISEALMHTPFIYLPFVASILLIIAFLYILNKFNEEVVTPQTALRAIGLVLLSVFLMATTREGVRVVSFAEPLELQAEATTEFMIASLAEYKKYKEEMANKPAVDLNDPVQLAEAKGCLSCHSIDMKLVGPSYKEVANKETDKTSLIHTIQNGSVNKYDVIPMPAQDVSNEEAEILANWILGLKEAK
jgi:cytochrome c